MTTARHFPTLPVASFGVLLLGIYAVMLLISGSHLFERNSDLRAFAVTFNLTVTVPVLFYLLVVRNTFLHWLTIAPVFLLSLLGASLVLPQGEQHYLDIIKHLAAPAELLLVGFLGVKAVRACDGREPTVCQGATATTSSKGYKPHCVRLSRRGLRRISWRTRLPFSNYALFAWRTQPDVGKGEIGFSYHQKNGYGGILVAVTLVAAVEIVAVHFLVASWSTRAAWILSAVSVYGIVWLLGYSQAIRLRPILLSEQSLYVRIGLLWSARIPLTRIASVQPVQSIAENRSTAGYLHAVTLGNPQFLIELSKPVAVHGLYGYTKKNVQRIGIAVDDRARFGAELANRIKSG